MAILTNLFGESPFGVLEAHGEKVHACVRLVGDLFDRLKAADFSRVNELADQIFALESEADKLRNHLHEMLAMQTLMSMKRDEFFGVLEHQDSMADRAEDIALTLSLRPLKLPDAVMTSMCELVDQVLKNCVLAAGVMSKLDLLVEASFSGRDATTVARLIAELSDREDGVKPRQVAVSRQLLQPDVGIPAEEVILWIRVVAYLADLSKAAARTGNGIRNTLKLKAGH